MKLRSRFILILAVLALASLACSLVSDGGGSSEPTAPSSVLFQDDFSSTSSGWDSYRDDETVTDYDSDGYRIQVLAPDTELWANPGLDFTDVRVEVDATRQSGPEDNDFGVICRYQDVDNFYYFVITSDGYYGILKVKDGETNLLTGEEFGTTDAIISGKNHIRADCVGDTLTLYVNGQQLDTRQDAEYTSGDVGLIAGSYTESGTDILFDDFMVLKP